MSKDTSGPHLFESCEKICIASPILLGAVTMGLANSVLLPLANPSPISYSGLLLTIDR